MSREEARVLDMIRRLEEKGKELEERQRRRGERMAWRRQERPAWIEEMQGSIPPAVEFHPTAAQFSEPLAYIASIAEEGAKYGACKIVPPPEWKPSSYRPSHMLPTKQQKVLARSEFVDATVENGDKKKVIGTAFQTSHQKNYRSYTIDEYEKLGHKRFQEYFPPEDEHPDENSIEREFWYTTSTANQFSVQYANDVEGSACGEDFGPFRLSELPRNGESPLGLEAENLPGINTTMLYVGVLFAHFCWHYEDNALYSVNYQHEGSTKTWYVVPGSCAANLENAVRKAFKRLSDKNHPLLRDGEKMLMRKTIMMSPSILLAEGVPVFRIQQHPRDFIVTFPRGYHSGFNHGFHIGEAVNFALSNWIPYGLVSLDRYRALGSMSCLDIQRCICTAARILLLQGPPCYDSAPAKAKPGKTARQKKDGQVGEGLPESHMHGKTCAGTPMAGAKLKGVEFRSIDKHSASMWAWAFRTLDLYQTRTIEWANRRGIPVKRMIDKPREATTSQTSGSPDAPRPELRDLCCACAHVLHLLYVERTADESVFNHACPEHREYLGCREGQVTLRVRYVPEEMTKLRAACEAWARRKGTLQRAGEPMMMRGCVSDELATVGTSAPAEGKEPPKFPLIVADTFPSLKELLAEGKNATKATLAFRRHLLFAKPELRATLQKLTQIRKHDAKVSPKNAVRNPHSAGKRRRPRKLPSPEHGNSEIATTDIGNEGEKSHTAKGENLSQEVPGSSDYDDDTERIDHKSTKRARIDLSKLQKSTGEPDNRRCEITTGQLSTDWPWMLKNQRNLSGDPSDVGDGSTSRLMARTEAHASTLSETHSQPDAASQTALRSGLAVVSTEISVPSNDPSAMFLAPHPVISSVDAAILHKATLSRNVGESAPGTVSEVCTGISNEPCAHDNKNVFELCSRFHNGMEQQSIQVRNGPKWNGCPIVSSHGHAYGDASSRNRNDGACKESNGSAGVMQDLDGDFYRPLVRSEASAARHAKDTAQEAGRLAAQGYTAPLPEGEDSNGIIRKRMSLASFDASGSGSAMHFDSETASPFKTLGHVTKHEPPCGGSGSTYQSHYDRFRQSPSPPRKPPAWLVHPDEW